MADYDARFTVAIDDLTAAVRLLAATITKLGAEERRQHIESLAALKTIAHNTADLPLLVKLLRAGHGPFDVSDVSPDDVPTKPGVGP